MIFLNVVFNIPFENKSSSSALRKLTDLIYSGTTLNFYFDLIFNFT